MMENDKLSVRLATLSPAKRALLELKLQQGRAGIAANITVQRRANRDSAPLSFAQQRLWFLDQLEPESFAYNERSALRLDGPLDIDALRSALSAIVERHEVLRTTYGLTDGGEPVQRIGAAVDIDLPVIDISEVAASQRDVEVQRIVAELKERPFDLSRDMPLRLALIRLAPSSHVLVEVKHHIASDGWSSGVFSRELATLYNSLSQGWPNPLSELPIQYADYAVWQREWLQGEVLEKQLAYWKGQLRDIPVLELPTDRPRSAAADHGGAKKILTLSQSLTDRLKALSQQQGATLFMTLLTAFYVLLHRYTGQDDITVGSPIAGRTRSETEGLIGFFVNTLVLRSRLSGDPTFKELLAQVRETALQAYEHQDLPFEKLVEELNPERNQSQTPLFQVSFAMQNVPRSNLEIFGLTVTPLDIDSSTAKFDISAAFIEREREMMLRIEYRTKLFEAATIERMLGHFKRLLEGIVESPDQRISELPLLTEAERHQLLVEWNDTKRDYPSDKCIHQLFEEQAKRTPEAVAVVFEDQQLTYRELNNRANQLAHYLQKLGVGPEVLVGICVERSIEMVVGLLGILKAGGAYVPLDSSYPEARLGYMVKDSGSPVLLTLQELTQRLPEYDGQKVYLDQEWQKIASESTANLSNEADENNLAYVIYTSGSTGNPKGVMIPHRAICNHMMWMLEAFPLNQRDRVAQKTPFSFDASVWEFFAPLISGAQLVLARPEGYRDAEYLVKFVQNEQITILQVVPTLLQMLLEQNMDQCTSLHRVFSGGEPLSAELCNRFSRQMAVPLSNLYGPTEAAIDSTTYTCSEDDSLGWVPIGRPIANTQIYILDGNLQPVPIGVPGELHIGGDGLARGYLNRPELTREKFIGNPFSNDGAARLYKTGDQARYLPDGNIEFLGRIDNQVKIRGYRIELGEIEAVLCQHPAIREAIVLAREDSPGDPAALARTDKRLVAYVVAPPDTSTNELRSFLKQKLPEYMVPSAFVCLDSLPLTPNGKVDRRALPASVLSRPELDETFSVPRTPTEDLLANIWAEVLKLEKVGIHDNFFDLGGHSLLATQLISRIRDAFRLELPLRSLFEAPTVAGLAEQIGSAREGEARIRTLPILAEPIDEESPLSFSQERFWFLEQLEPNNLAYKIIHGFHLTGPVDVEAVEKSLTDIMRRHESLRTTFHQSHGVPVQLVSEQWSFRLNVIDGRQELDVDFDTKVQRLFENESRRPFDLSTDLLLRGILLRLSDSEHALLISSHHIAWDHWSDGLFFRELSVLYQAFAAAKPSPLAELPIQYKHYAQWQRNIFEGAQFDDYLAYWKEQLVDAPPSLNLPADHPRQPLHNRRGGRQALVLPKQLRSALGSFSKEASVTLFMTFLAAFQTLLHRMTGEDDIVVGTPVAGRDRSETEGLIGLFLNSLTLRTNLSGNPTFLELLARVREVALGAYDHQELPFEKLVAELQPERDLSRTAIFQVFINQYNFKEASLELDGLSVTRLRYGSSAPQFDLEFFIREYDDGTHLTFAYDSDLFEATTIARMLGHFQTLLEGIAANPEQRISELPLLTDAEKHRLVVQWNDTRRNYPSDQCIHQLFEQQAANSPDAVALVCERVAVTYCELNGRANQLAKYLQRRGVGRGALVAICLERSVEMIVSLLAILKAGAAYVPMDPDYPGERLEFILRDTGAVVLITEQKMLAQIPARDVEFVLIDRDAREILNERDDNLERNVAVTADDLAYVIYTSGSTGNPKGVEVCHRGVNRLLFGVDYAQFGAGETFAHLAATSFDASTFEIWGALLHGAKCVLYPKGIPGVKELGDFLHENKVTTLWLTASLFNVVIDQAPEALSNVRQLLIGGEALSVPHVRRGLALLPRTQIINGYGPTESTTFTCCYRIPPGLDASVRSIPIGQPIGNTQVYLLDSRLAPVPVGVSGELYIGGVGLARGYLNRPQLTDEKFIAHPFTDEPGAKLYKTGDLARYLPDGNIEFIGRIDNQVKVRGFRIELGEIEAALAQHREVKECVVLARETSPGEKHLVAYVVPAGEQAPQAGELRNFLKTKLPDFMLPSSVGFLECLPLTTNGKVDRKSLLGLSGEQCGQDNGYVAPRNDLEDQLAVIWSEALRVERIGIHDNFFDLGGHSLMAVRVVSEVEKRMGKQVPLALLFRCPTIAQLAGELQPASQSEIASLVIAVQPTGSKEPLFCIHGYGAYAQLARDLAPDRPVYGIGKHYTGKRVLRTQVEVLAKEYLESVFAIQPRGPYHLAGHSYGGLVAYEMAQLLKKDGHQVAFLGLIDTIFPKPRKPIIERFRLSILDNWYALSRLSGAARMRYLAQTMKASAQWRLKALQCFGYHLIQRKPPPELLEFYIDEILFDGAFAKAQARYRPLPYSGVVHYFKASENRNGLVEWRAITNRRLVLHEIPGNHTSIMLEPGLAELSRSIAACLTQSAANHLRPSHSKKSAGNPLSLQPAVVYKHTALRR